MLRKSKAPMLVLGLLLIPPVCSKAGAADDKGLRRTMVVSALTQKGELVNGLTPEFFAANFRGRPVTIESATYDTAPRRVVLLLDTSGSMRDSREVQLTLADYLLAWTSPATSVALLTFGNGVRDRLPLATDRAPARAELQKLRSLPKTPPMGSNYTGKTALWIGIQEALQLLDPPQAGDAICLISDGGDNASRGRDRVVRRRLAESGVRVFSVLVTLPPSTRIRSPGEADGPEVLRELSLDTGGDGVGYLADALDWQGTKWAAEHGEAAGKKSAALLAPLAAVAREINAFYRLEIKLPKPVDKPRDWHLKLVDPQTGKTDRLLLLRYPIRLMPAGPAAKD